MHTDRDIQHCILSDGQPSRQAGGGHASSSCCDLGAELYRPPVSTMVPPTYASRRPYQCSSVSISGSHQTPMPTSRGRQPAFTSHASSSLDSAGASTVALLEKDASKSFHSSECNCSDAVSRSLRIHVLRKGPSDYQSTLTEFSSHPLPIRPSSKRMRMPGASEMQRSNASAPIGGRGLEKFGPEAFIATEAPTTTNPVAPRDAAAAPMHSE